VDNGMGIPEEIQRKIWEPFFYTKGSKGTGLGLAMTRKAIEEHGGQINLVSNQGEGTTFTILLPVVDAPESDSDDDQGLGEFS
jgi:signal transduction histidine kinase